MGRLWGRSRSRRTSSDSDQASLSFSGDLTEELEEWVVQKARVPIFFILNKCIVQVSLRKVCSREFACARVQCGIALEAQLIQEKVLNCIFGDSVFFFSIGNKQLKFAARFERYSAQVRAHFCATRAQIRATERNLNNCPKFWLLH